VKEIKGPKRMHCTPAKMQIEVENEPTLTYDNDNGYGANLNLFFWNCVSGKIFLCRRSLTGSGDGQSVGSLLHRKSWGILGLLSSERRIRPDFWIENLSSSPDVESRFVDGPAVLRAGLTLIKTEDKIRVSFESPLFS